MAEVGSTEVADGEADPARREPPGRIVLARRALGFLFAVTLLFVPADSARDAVPARPPSVAAPGPNEPSGNSGLPAAPRLPEEGAARGWVIDGSGVPVAGVTVALGLDGAPDGAEPRTVAVSADDGAFTASVPSDGTYQVALSGESIFSAEVRWQLPGPAVRVLVTRRQSIEGVVTDRGSPAAGVQVLLSDGSGPASLAATTDAAGGFRFDDLVPALYEIWAQGQARASPVLGVARFGPGPHPRVEIAMQPATVIRGRVIDADGADGLSASLVLTSSARVTRGRLTTSDPDGYFQFDGVLPGRFAIEADAAGYMALTEYAVQVEDGESETAIELRLRKGGVAVGRVEDVHGEPVVGASLILSPRDRKGGLSYSAAERSQRALRFAAGGRPEVATVRARWVHPLAGERLLPTNPSRHFGASRSGQRPAECGRGHCGVDLGETLGQVVHAAADGEVVRVVRESRSQAGRFVAIEHAGELRTAYMHLDEIRGDLEEGARVRAGEPIGTIGHSGMRVVNPHLHFALSQRRGEQLWFIDPEPMLRHAVVLLEPAAFDASGPATEPAGSGEVETLVATVLQPAPGAAPLTEAGRAAAAGFVTGADGRFEIDGLRRGTYVAWAFHSELPAGASAPFRIRAGRETSGIVVTLSAGVILFGRVSDPRGPVAGARVVAETGRADAARPVAEAVTDDLGNYALAPLSGTIALRVTAPGHGLAERRVELSNRGAEVLRREESFVLAPADAELSGRISDPDGFPLRGAVVVIASGPSARGRATETDDNGRFGFAALSAGGYELRVTCRDYPPLAGRATTGESAALSVAQGGGVRLAIRDSHTRAPMPGVVVKASGPGGARRQATADGDGLAELVPLEPGKWQIEVRRAGYVRVRRPIVVSAGHGPRAIAVEPAVVELYRGATLAGVVRDQNGDRVAGATVDSGGVSTTADQVGFFRLVDVPTGRAIITARRGNEQGVLALELAPGDELTTLQIPLVGKPD